jgi:glycosyltransferase involved in cell wall biosynthesis
VTTVRWARFASDAPMGQQVHESRIFEELTLRAGDGWVFSETAISSFRSGGSSTRRVPLKALWAAPYAVAALAGGVVYGRSDLVHRLDLRCPPSGRREVVTIHDLPPLRFEDEGTLPRWAARSARAAAAVICPSEFAAQEVRELLGVREVRVVPNGVDPAYATADALSAEERDALGLSGLLVLHAGGATRRKNLEALARSWPEVLESFPDARLVMCGPAHPRREQLFAGQTRATYLGHRDPSFVARLMRSAEAVVVPSTYEGFGLPALEALAAGTTVVAAARGALPEVCGGAAVLVEPSPAGVANGILTALRGGPEIERLRDLGREHAQRFSWASTARQTLRVYEEALA